MATLRALTQKVRSKLKSLGRTAATKNVMEALDKISAKNGDNNLGTENWKNFITAFNQVKFTSMRDKDVTLLITALFSAIVRSGCSALTVPASQTATKKSYPGKRKKGDKNPPKINLGQALVNGDGVAAKKILDKTEFGNVLKNITTNTAGLQVNDITKFSNNITKFLNRVGKITSMWRHLPSNKKTLEAVRTSFEYMTNISCCVQQLEELNKTVKKIETMKEEEAQRAREEHERNVKELAQRTREEHKRNMKELEEKWAREEAEKEEALKEQAKENMKKQEILTAASNGLRFAKYYANGFAKNVEDAASIVNTLADISIDEEVRKRTVEIVDSVGDVVNDLHVLMQNILNDVNGYKYKETEILTNARDKIFNKSRELSILFNEIKKKKVEIIQNSTKKIVETATEQIEALANTLKTLSATAEECTSYISETRLVFLGNVAVKLESSSKKLVPYIEEIARSLKMSEELKPTSERVRAIAEKIKADAQEVQVYTKLELAQ